MARRFDAVASIANKIADSIPKDHDDPNTVLALTGKDPLKILAWVKSNTHIVPYAGMLRGPVGVLQDRAGNSLDRALFLADLLHRAGMDARIARQQLSDPSAEALLARFEAPWPTSVLPPNEKTTLLSAIGTSSEFGAPSISRAIDASLAARSAATAQVLELSSKVTPALLQVLGDSRQRDDQLKEDAVVLLKDHFWVQQQKDNRWQDLDPDADVLGPLSATQTFTPGALPTDLQQKVTVTLSVETLAAGNLSETQVLRQSWLPSQLTGMPITIVHKIFPDPIPTATDEGTFKRALLTNLTGVSTVLPGLLVGGNGITGQLYSFDGKVAAATPTNLAAMGGAAIVNSTSLSKGLASVFGESVATPSTPPASSSVVTAEWLDIEVTIPGQPERKERRAIFDLIGANKRATQNSLTGFALDDQLRLRRALSLQVTVDMWVGSNALGHSSVALVENRQLSSIAAKAAGALRDGKDLVAIPGADPVNPVFWTWNALRQQRNTPCIFDRPNIALFWRKLSLRSDQSVLSQSAFDIVSNGAATDTQFNNRVTQGVVDTAAEFVALNRSEPSLNTAAAFAADISVQRKWSLFSTTSNGKPMLNPAAIARIGAALAMRNLAIAPTQRDPAKTLSANWWRVEPTGATLGIGFGGMGVDAVEYSETLHISMANARKMRAVGCAASIGFSLTMDSVDKDPSLIRRHFRTGVEGAACLVGIASKGQMVARVPLRTYTEMGNLLTELAAFGFNIGYTLLTTFPESPEPTEKDQPAEPASDDSGPNQSFEPPSRPPMSLQPGPVCGDDGC